MARWLYLSTTILLTIVCPLVCKKCSLHNCQITTTSDFSISHKHALSFFFLQALSFACSCQRNMFLNYIYNLFVKFYNRQNFIVFPSMYFFFFFLQRIGKTVPRDIAYSITHLCWDPISHEGYNKSNEHINPAKCMQ